VNSQKKKKQTSKHKEKLVIYSQKES